jgi:hypothetical protein
MKVQVKTKTTEYDVDIDQAWVWVRLEEELGLTVVQAQEKMASGSTKAITYAIWIASDTEEPFNVWVKSLEGFDVIDDDDPKEIADKA